MNKKLMAVAVAGALAAPVAAFAQSNVEIYGRANLGLDQWQSTGSQAGAAQDYKSRTRVYDSGSRLGFRGTEALGNGLKAIFVLESGVNFDTGSLNGQSGAANTSSGTLASRDSYVGIAGNWGDVRFGRQSIYWVGGLNNQTGANYINQEIGWFNGAGLGRVAGPSARTSNVMSYNSPTWSGFNFSASYAPNSEAAVAAANTDASIMGVTLRYEGPIGVQFDHGENIAASGGVNRQKIIGNKLSVGYVYQPGARIAVLVNRTQNNNANAQANFAAAGDNITQGYWGVNWEHMIGNVQLLGMWSKMNKANGCSALNVNTGVTAGTNGCDGTEATGYTAAVKYFFSKRTQVYASWISHKTGFNQISDVTGGGYSSGAGGALPAASAGADLRILAVGVWHSF
jgi:predicted porin